MNMHDAMRTHYDSQSERPIAISIDEILNVFVFGFGESEMSIEKKNKNVSGIKCFSR